MRKLVNTLSPTGITVTQLIEAGSYAAAITVLQSFRDQLSSEDQTLLTATSAQFVEYENLKNEGETSLENLKNTLAKVRNNLIYLANQLT